MSYFSKFPLMIYDMKGDDKFKLLPDILRRVKTRASIKSSLNIFAVSYTHLTLPTNREV